MKRLWTNPCARKRTNPYTDTEREREGRGAVCGNPVLIFVQDRGELKIERASVSGDTRLRRFVRASIVLRVDAYAVLEDQLAS